jgi:hypothetical protein
MTLKMTLKVSVMVVLLGGVALPVYGNIRLSPFFSPSEKYRQWFHETTWLQDARAQNRAGWFRSKSLATSTAIRYSYPDKKFVMTDDH